MKRIGLLLCIVLVAAGSAFAAPGSETGGAGGAVAVSGAGQFPIVKEKVTLTFVVPHSSDVADFNENDYSKWKEELTNVHIDWEMMPGADFAERRNLILASKNYPDAFFASGLTNDLIIKYGMQEKTLIPLNKLIDKYGVETKKVFKLRPLLKGLSTYPDGNIYAMPKWNGAYHIAWSQKMWINMVFLKALNLKMPETTEQYYQVLKAFKTQDPNRNGKADEIPLSGMVGGWMGDLEGFLMCAFIYDDTYYGDRLLNIKGKIDAAFNKPAFRDGLRYINRLYKEGLIYPASWTQNFEQGVALGENPGAEILGSFPGGTSMNGANIGGERYSHFEAVPPLTGPAGVRTTGYFPLLGATPGVFAISSTCKYPEVAFRWADHCYTEESTIRMREGAKGKTWDYAAGEVNVLGEPAKWKKLEVWNEQAQTAHFGNTTLDYFTNEIHLLDRAFPKDMNMFNELALEKLLYIQTKKYDWFATDVVWTRRMVFTPEEVTDFSTLDTEIKSYVSQNLVKFMTGELSLDNDWDGYLAGFDKLQLPKYLALIQKAYDRQYKK